jgi:ligand-binding sensor domain-containing protein/serine phosphatase RsbU (regulator of sigma subunit)
MKTARVIHSILIICSATNLFGQNQSIPQSQIDTQIIVAPKVILLSSRPKPNVVIVPNKPAGTYEYPYRGGTKRVDLLPPVTKALEQFAPEAQGIGFFVTYTTDNGLALDPVACGYKDNLGNLWFGTAGGGVSRYDGKSFTNFTTVQGLAYNLVCSIIQDKAGNIWFGTAGGGVSRYDGKVFTNFSTEQGLTNNDVYSIEEDNDGNLWFGTVGGGVSRFDGKVFTSFTIAEGLANNVVLSIKKDKSGNLWFATDGGGVSRYDGKTFTNFTKAQGLANNRVWCITEDNAGNMWFGTFGDGVSCFDGKTFTNYSTQHGLAYSRVRSIAVDKMGNVWVGTFGGGVSRFEGKNLPVGKPSFVSFTTVNGLANDIVYSITEDNSGNLWFGTYGGGVSRYDGKSFTNFFTQQGLPNNSVRCIKEDKMGNLWFGTEGGGASRYDGKSFKSFSLPQGLANDNAWGIEEDKAGNLWFGTDGGGVSRYDGKSFTNFTTTQGLASDVVLCVKEDKAGNLWFGTDGEGVSRFDGISFTNFTEEHGLANNSVWSIMEDKKGNLWFGTDGGGVSCYDGITFKNYTTQQGLASNTVWSIAEDSFGNIWFGTEEGGVARFDGESFTSFTTKNGLPDNVITQVLFYNDYIVLGSNVGIAVLTSFNPKNALNANESDNGKPILPQNSLTNSELQNYTPVFSIYNSATGYPVKDVNVGYNAMYLDSKGIIWAATGSDKTALVRIDLSATTKNSNHPIVILQNLKVNNEDICWHNLKRLKNKDEKLSLEDSLAIINEEKITFGKILDSDARIRMINKFGNIDFDSITRFYPFPQNLVLPYNHNNITFEFAAIEPARPYLVKYQYMLEGYDEDWSPITNGTSASFGNIYEGTYTFKLKACAPNGIWSEPVVYTFSVLPPWYRSWLMYCLYAIAIVSALYFIYRLRVAQLHREKVILEKKIELRTEQLKEAFEELLAKNEEINTQMNVIEHKNINITSSIQYAKIIQRAIFPKLDKLDAYFNEYFVLFLPKDIVSGDFYYAKQKGKNLFIAAADCTGHGVPGAFMSVLGISQLNEIISKGVLTKPNEILNELRIRIKNSLHQEGQKGQTQDGMDIALCILDLESTTIQYAGAHSPLYIFRKNSIDYELIEIKADLMPIGVHPKDEKSFTNSEIQLQHGDTIYLFTDGYVSQTGGLNFETFKRKRFQETLLKIQGKSLDEQKQILEQTITNWQGNYEQVDDILIIGMKYSG